MTKQEIEKMFNTCNNYHSCALCPYNPEDISRFIGDRWVGGCPDYDRKLVYAMSKGYRKAEEVRKETAKEFAEKLKIKAIRLSEIENYHVCNLIDELLKEIVK